MNPAYSNSSGEPDQGSSNIVGRLLAFLIGLPLCGAVYWSVSIHPLGPLWPGIALAVYALLLLRWPHLWLFLVPAILPVVDLTKHTGATLLADSDILLLLTLALGYLDIARRRSRRLSQDWVVGRVPLLGWFVFIVLAVSYGLSAYKGFMPFAFPEDQLADYHSRWNSLRVAKGFFLPFLFLPLFHRALSERGGHALACFGWGLAAGLGNVVIVGLYERVAYTGLLNFSADYRITSSFWEMNVGGAALDGWLGLSLPFAAWALFRAKGVAAHAFALLLGACACYIALVTFSRGVYAATFASLIVGALAALPSVAIGEGRQPRSRTLVLSLLGLLMLAAYVWAALSVFRLGGYRTLLTLMFLVPAGHLVAIAGNGSRPFHLIMGLVVGVLGSAMNFGLYWALPKGAYWAFGADLLLFASSAFIWHRGGRQSPGALIGFFIAMLVASPMCGEHWGGQEAMRDAAIVAAGLGVLVVLAMLLRGQVFPPWQVRQSVGIFGVCLVAGMGVAISGGYYMGSRFATSSQDMGTRERHWNEGVSWLATTEDWVIGKGVGRYPETFLYRASQTEAPGTYALPVENGRQMLRLSSASHFMGWGEVLRVSQIIHGGSAGEMDALVEIRAKQTVHLYVEVCNRHLIYAMNCASQIVEVPGKPEEWQNVRMRMQRTPSDVAGPGIPVNRVFAIALESLNGSADVRKVQLLDGASGDLLRNGDFSQGSNFWFSSSDHDHMPWHIKSLAFNVLFDQGIMGVVGFAMLWFIVLVRLAGLSREWPMAPYLLASYAGFFVVGLFDSLIDVPRLAMLFYLMSGFALTVGMRDQHIG